MSIEVHPDFQYEKNRLAYTKRYIEKVIKVSEVNKGQYKENIKQAMIDLDYLDSSLSYINILTNSKFLEIASSEIDALKRIKNKPYFSRINLKIEGHSNENVYYIGKTSLYDKSTQEPIIVDWRSPIANVYYDGRLGEVSYESNEGLIKGYLSLKRRFEIENGELIYFEDVDLTTTDELLQKSLSGKADQRLTEIVSTIQAEQNKVIRADLTRPIIVQGAAGSGKTTIALHRISYFIYHFADTFKPENLMIIAPSKMFIGYISAALPELGVDRIRQSTYIDFVLECIGKKIKIIDPNQKLISFINHEYDNEHMVKWLSRFKGSLIYKKLIDQYLKHIRNELCPTEDFKLERFRLTSGKRLKKLFIEDYKYLPFYSRIEKIKNVLKSELKHKKKTILTKIEKTYDDALEKALYHTKDPAKRKKQVTQLMEQKEKLLNQINIESKSVVNTYMSSFPKKTLLEYYKGLFSNKTLFHTYAENILTNKQADFFFKYNQQLLAENQVEVEDLAALFYMQHKIFGIKQDVKVKKVVIDEAQDYSEFQLYALKEGLETDMFTIVGDLAQGIHSYRGLKSWKVLTETIFPRANYLTMQKSYRTTIDIMNVANEVLNAMEEEVPNVDPVVRRGPKPIYYSYDKEKDLVENIHLVLQHVKKKGELSIALIGKTEKECKALYRLLKKSLNAPIQLLKENQQMEKGHLVIVPSYLSKGLEFDVVFIVSLQESYSLDEIDIKLLYVAMTRPMHELYMFAKQKEDLLLNNVNPIYFEEKKHYSF
ncbi:RNA polymerase recycling motor HelD [Anoxybacillus sp. TBDG-1]